MYYDYLLSHRGLGHCSRVRILSKLNFLFWDRKLVMNWTLIKSSKLWTLDSLSHVFIMSFRFASFSCVLFRARNTSLWACSFCTLSFPMHKFVLVCMYFAQNGWKYDTIYSDQRRRVLWDVIFVMRIGRRTIPLHPFERGHGTNFCNHHFSFIRYHSTLWVVRDNNSFSMIQYYASPRDNYSWETYTTKSIVQSRPTPFKAV